MAIHQKLVLTQRLEDIEMTDLRPANVMSPITFALSSSRPLLTFSPAEWSPAGGEEDIRVQQGEAGLQQLPGATAVE